MNSLQFVHLVAFFGFCFDVDTAQLQLPEHTKDIVNVGQKFNFFTTICCSLLWLHISCCILHISLSIINILVKWKIYMNKFLSIFCYCRKMFSMQEFVQLELLRSNSGEYFVCLHSNKIFFSLSFFFLNLQHCLSVLSSY